jgi:hypothetical protein
MLSALTFDVALVHGASVGEHLPGTPSVDGTGAPIVGIAPPILDSGDDVDTKPKICGWLRVALN